MREILSRSYKVQALEALDHSTTRITLSLLGGPANSVTETEGTCPRRVSFALPISEAHEYVIGRTLWLSLTDGKAAH